MSTHSTHYTDASSGSSGVSNKRYQAYAPDTGSRASLESEKAADDDAESEILHRQRTNVSELSRIISGIRDDRIQDAAVAHEYRDTGVPDAVIAQELEAISRKNTTIADEEQVVGEKELKLSEVDVEEEENIPPPDEGYAWVIAIIAMLSVFATWGSNASFGVFLQYYIDANVFPGATKYDFALIGGLVVCLAQGCSPFVSMLYRVIGIKAITALGITLQTAGYILASFATKIWQLYVCQGVIVGMSFSMLFIPATLVLPTWFDKHRATAFGICISGAGSGGVVFSLSIHKVFEMTGNQRWGLRLAALMALVAALPCFLLKPRYGKTLPFKQRLSKQFIRDNFKLIFDFSVLSTWPMMVWCVWFSIAMTAYVVVLFSVSSYATSIGLSSSKATLLTAILNIGQIVGRPGFGFVADWAGRSNVAVLIPLLICIWILAFWINASSFAAMVPFCLILGGVAGIGTLMSQPVCSDILGDPSKLPAGWSAMNIAVSIPSLVAEVIALALTRSNSTQPYLHLQIFVGVCFFTCSTLALLIRSHLVNKVIRARLACSINTLQELTGSRCRYLTVAELQKTDEEKADIVLLTERIERYEVLLRASVGSFFIRMFYPIKV
ncbi:hypothetical protein PSN45_005113 [Yamadazyma tenuis]|uniref:MFS general substrate transporter n=1 Tax=Candida tenuis (strain ATCC 10573 / BCRC 21748 / CBS 615 / JCM 9827 / NBRC 10315 / NRRL Y-1498 / VKM Y-70) TaxID=590646 RepID=G3B2U8_CANTC|nr:uncharacterized protein CANTEDRAFT_134078 [Yamadazyma tenuis ATCC 10573]EGV64766.1 hypothetical protein CANTEDRAFT_134078 [Yamadazyma tenuis ATCC 10573]WEJ97557.1 hypothetical protein PSN45_005113 [Yamadazyma tenuis]